MSSNTSYIFRLVDGCHVLQSLVQTDKSGDSIYALIHKHGGQYTLTIGQTDYVLRTPHFKKVYDNKTMHFAVASLSSAYELLDQLIKNQLF